MDEPRYGTEPTEAIPVYQGTDDHAGVMVRVLAGEFSTDGAAQLQGPFKTLADVMMLDVMVEAGASFEYDLPKQYDNCIAYVYGDTGSGHVNERAVRHSDAVRFDASDADGQRKLVMAAGEQGLNVMLFAGKRLNQEIAWRGPFVMTTQDEIMHTIQEYRSGTFLRKRATWDYKRIGTAPPGTFSTKHSEL